MLGVSSALWLGIGGHLEFGPQQNIQGFIYWYVKNFRIFHFVTGYFQKLFFF